MREPRLRKGKLLAQGHTAGGRGHLHLDPVQDQGLDSFPDVQLPLEKTAGGVGGL